MFRAQSRLRLRRRRVRRFGGDAHRVRDPRASPRVFRIERDLPGACHGAGGVRAPKHLSLCCHDDEREKLHRTLFAVNATWDTLNIGLVDPAKLPADKNAPVVVF